RTGCELAQERPQGSGARVRCARATRESRAVPRGAVRHGRQGRHPQMSSLRRRDFLALALGGVLPLPLLRYLRQAPPRPRRLLQLNGYAIDAETPLDLLTDYLTPNELFFVRAHWQPQLPDPRSWRLVIEGEVANPLSLSLAELKRLPRSSAT